MDRYDCLQSRRLPHRHLQSCKSAPGNSEHADVSVRPRLMSKPRDHLLAIDLFLLGIFALRWTDFTRAESTNIHAPACISAPRKICVLRIIAGSRAVIFAIRKVFEQGRELLARFRSLRHI